MNWRGGRIGESFGFGYEVYTVARTHVFMLDGGRFTTDVPR